MKWPWEPKESEGKSQDFRVSKVESRLTMVELRLRAVEEARKENAKSAHSTTH